MVEGPKLPEHDVIALSDSEVSALINCIQNQENISDHAKAYNQRMASRDLAIIMVFLGTGIRISELVGLNLSDIDTTDEDKIYLHIIRKGRDQDKVRVIEPVYNALADYIEFSRPLLTNSQSENAVFVHRNEKGEVVGGEIQGINSFKRFKGVVAGTSDSVFMFTPFPAKDGKLRRAYIFESAIDLMSFYTLCNKKNKLMEGAAFISMAGLKPTIPKQLQAQGVEIISCVDNDEKGRQFEADNGFVRSESVKKHLDNQGFKDWNEMLVFQSENGNLNLMENQQHRSLTNFFGRGKQT